MWDTLPIHSLHTLYTVLVHSRCTCYEIFGGGQCHTPPRNWGKAFFPGVGKKLIMLCMFWMAAEVGKYVVGRLCHTNNGGNATSGEEANTYPILLAALAKFVANPKKNLLYYG